MSRMPVSGYIAQMMGMRMPPSFVPNPMLEFSDDMTFSQRLVNSLLTWAFDYLFVGNSHFSINNPRPIFQDIEEIGGIHYLYEWLSAAPDGFIFFSLGTVIKGVTLPEETRKMFLNAFSRLKQRVLWKFESEQMADLQIETLN
ncbi:UDP-glucuronosyltransferase 2B13 [Folsomia candida]|uniref:UDP-glucuronosyltransferase 2B13 n=1 Tax=Folsomia candida TaxID=158441 RepID=UPI000B8F59B0|nr:UDP-glucuronosyltransferase 2B13 [Folsomia candida]